MYAIRSYYALLKRGLLGMVLDPDFAQNHYVYLFYTTAADTPANVVERYTEVNFRADSSSRLVLMEQSILTPCGAGFTHNGSAMGFGADRITSYNVCYTKLLRGSGC